MIEPVTYPGKMTDAGFVPNSPGAWKAGKRAFVGHDVEVTLAELRKTRSTKQNRAWWGVVIKMFCETMGYRHASQRDREYVHEQVLIAIGHYEVVKVFGKETKRACQTRNLTTAEFKERYEAAQQLGAEYGIVIPDPMQMGIEL